jgi:hypothetical protein
VLVTVNDSTISYFIGKAETPSRDRAKAKLMKEFELPESTKKAQQRPYNATVSFIEGVKETEPVAVADKHINIR